MGQRTVVGVFENPAEATRATQELQHAGFSRDVVDIANRPGGAADVNYADTDKEERRDDETAIGRFFRELFTDDDDTASRYSRIAERSGSIVTVHCRDNENAEDAAQILDRCGAIDVDERAEQYGYDAAARRTDARTAQDSQKIPVVREEMHVSKREVETGGARIRSRIIERPVEETLRLREERVFVNRTPVDRPASEADLNTFREGTVELRERAEVPVVNKESRVVEEVSLGKDVEEREEKVRGSVRNTEVDVERLEGKSRRDPNDHERAGTPGKPL